MSEITKDQDAKVAKWWSSIRRHGVLHTYGLLEWDGLSRLEKAELRAIYRAALDIEAGP